MSKLKQSIEASIALLQELGMEPMEVYEYIDSIKGVLEIKLQDPER